MERLDCAVIGAGVIGLAIARELALRGREVVVLETARLIGTQTSSRNSEVVHAGIYYPPSMLKTRLCVQGKTMLYAYCREHGIEAKATGKLIVATTSDQCEYLTALKNRADGNGVTDLRLLSAADVRAIEPEVECIAALFSPSSGIIDSHGFMLGLQGDLEDAGGAVAFASGVTGGYVTEDGIVLEVGGEAPAHLLCNTVVNAAGLWAPDIARGIEGVPQASIPPHWFAKGHYFSIVGPQPRFSHLIYPVPEPGGLGVHATLDLAGQIRFGPDVEWVDSIDYSLDASRGDIFYGLIRRFWPALTEGSLQPSYTGIRPKLSGPGEPPVDFMIKGKSEHGVPGLINLYGIESPGLTASLALAETVADRLGGRP